MSVTSIPSTISAVEQSIAPLGNKVTGMPIHASNFNALVEAIRQLLQIARLQESGMKALLEAQFALKEHEHLSSVSLQWLDADLRARIGDGALQLRQLVESVRDGLRAAQDELASLRRASTAMQRSVDGFSVNDADRTAAIRTVEGRITKLSEGIRRIDTIGDDIALIRTKFDLLEEVLDHLGVEGRLISVVDLRQQVREHEDVLENLNDRDGQPIRIVTLQQKLRELEAISGLGEGLEQRLAALAAVMEANLDRRLTEKLDASVGASSPLSTTLQGNVTAVVSLDRRLEVLSTALDTHVDATAERFADLTKKVDADIVTAVGNVDRKVNDASTALAGVTKKLDGHISTTDQKFTDLTKKVDADIATATDLTKKLDATSNALTGTNTQVGNVSKKLDGHITTTDQKFTDLTKKVDADIATATDLTKKLDANVIAVATVDKKANDASTALAGLTTQVGNVSKKLDGHITTTEQKFTDLTKKVDADIATAAGLTTSVNQATTQVANLTKKVDGDLTKKLDGHITTTDQKFTDLTKKVDANAGTVTSLSSKVDGHGTQLVDITTRLDANIGGVTDLNAKLRDVLKRLAALDVALGEQLDQRIARVAAAQVAAVAPVNIEIVRNEIKTANAALKKEILAEVAKMIGTGPGPIGPNNPQA